MSKHKYSKEFLEKTGLTEEELKAKGFDGDVPEEQQPNPFNATAIGMSRVRDGGGHKYTLVEIPYNLETGDTGTIKTVMEEHSKEEIVNQFKFTVDKLNLFFYEDRND